MSLENLNRIQAQKATLYGYIICEANPQRRKADRLFPDAGGGGGLALWDTEPLGKDIFRC